MKKEKVDQIITDYLKKLYGFAVKKSFSYDEAEDLCSEIILEVYQSLLKAEDVANVEGYIWRISEHTYAKYVSSKKKHEGVSIDGMEIPYYDDFFSDDDTEIKRLRREIAFLSETRRKIVYMFYYKRRSIVSISEELCIPEGTVKWHLNKARSELKEGFSMERKIGKLGLAPIEATGFGHNGNPGRHGGPEYYLQDKINLNIVYSVYHSPKTKDEIAEELGVTPVYLEDRIALLEDNGYIIKTKGDRYTTYVRFDPEKYSLELQEKIIMTQMKIARDLVEEYVPLVREAVKDVKDVYIPGGNRELFEAAAVFYGVANKCCLSVDCDLSKYVIKTTDGGSYMAFINIKSEVSDPDYEPVLKDLPAYWACGDMNRWSEKYPSVYSWSIDTRFSSRQGAWENNRTADYEYLYEYIKGDISDNLASSEKIKRLKKRSFITEDGKPNIMIIKGAQNELFDKIPTLDQAVKDRFASIALESAMVRAKSYPTQMQDLIVAQGVVGFIASTVALMVMDILYSNGTFKALTENERVTSNLLMFSDLLPIL